MALLALPEAWNWTPVARTLRNVAGGGHSLQEKLVAAGAVPVLVHLLSFGRPALQVETSSEKVKPAVLFSCKQGGPCESGCRLFFLEGLRHDHLGRVLRGLQHYEDQVMASRALLAS